jgi:hypothetical protein
MVKLKEHDFPYESFIGGFYIPEKICDDLIGFFKDNYIDATPGVILKDGEEQVNDTMKESMDLPVSPYDENNANIEFISALQSALNEYQKKYKMLTQLGKYTLTSNWNIQHYKAGGGYKFWHCERASNNTRLLVWMTYLNDVPDGGTEFLYQKITSPAKKGLTMFWPTDWTHTHKGQISKDHEKYIATGWLDFVDD